MTGPAGAVTPAGSGAAAPVLPAAAVAAIAADIVEMSAELLARLAAMPRAIALQGTTGAPRPDGTVPLRTQLGELVLRPAQPVPADRPATVQIPALPQGDGGARIRLPLQAVLLTQPAFARADMPPHAALRAPAVLLAASALRVPAATPRVAAGPAPAGQPGYTATGALPSRPSEPGAASIWPLDPDHAPGLLVIAEDMPGDSPSPTPGRPAVAPQQPAPGMAEAAPARVSPGAMTAPRESLPSALLLQQAAEPVAPTPPPAPKPALPALAEALELLARTAPAAEEAPPHLPRTDEPLAGPLLQALDRLRRQDLSGLLGQEAAARLDREAPPELRAALSHELLSQGRPARDGQGAEWRSWQLPVIEDGRLALLQLDLRRIQPDEHHASADAPPPRAQHRFLVEVALSRLGAMQLDGLLRDRRLDLIVRSAIRLPVPQREELARIFAAACEEARLVGAVIFQSGMGHWITLTPDASPIRAPSFSA